jgi:tRNA threonylcarbamoyladenosine biosynthesis protein TsaB
MTFLAIETATRQLGVAVVEDEHVLSSYELLAEYPHAVELPNALTRVLKAAHTTLERVEAVVVDIGPGSFTGLRIGLAFVKALVFPTKKPLIGVASLDVLAANLPFAPRLICPILDAKQKNVYAALYRLDAGGLLKQTEYLLGPVDELLARITEPTLFLGDGCTLYRDRILERCPQAQFAAPEFWLPRVATLGRLGRERFLQGHRDEARNLVPLYLYPLDCSVRSPERPTSVLSKTA